MIQLIGQSAYAVHTDRLGTAQMLTDAEGKLVWQAQYSPFGKAMVLLDDVVFKLRLPGQYEDSETGTHYNYLRDYDPQTGRYLTRDPISINGGLNTYLYANADPLNRVDVLGLMPSSSLFAQGTIINVLEYDELHGYASDRNEVAYFNLLFRLTQEPRFQDLAEGYSLYNEGLAAFSTSMYLCWANRIWTMA